MVEAGNGIGGRTKAEYTPTTFQPQSELVGTNEGAVKQVVRALTVEDGRGGASTTRHLYSGARYDRKERVSLGFAWTKTTLPCLQGETACPYVVTTNSQELASVGKPLVTTRYDGAGSPLTARSFEYRNRTALPRTSVLVRANDVVYGSGQEKRQTATVYDYDEWGNQTLVRTEGDVTASGDELETVLAYRPNLASYIVSRVAQVEQRVPNDADSLTRVRYEYDGSGSWGTPPTKGDVTAVVRRLKWEPPAGGSASEDRDVVERRGYDAVGNLTSVTDETNRTVTTTYDSVDNLFVEKVTNAAGEVETKVTRFNRLCGAAEEVEDANGQKTETQYDTLCRPTRTDLPGDGFVERKYLSLGDPGQQRTRVETLAATGVSGVDWSETSFDGLGRTYETRRRGPESQGDIVTKRTFNPRGGLESSTEPFYAGEPGRVTSYEYDTLGRLVQTRLPGGQHTSEMSYGLWSQTATDPNGKTVEARFDAYGRTVEVVRKLDGRDIVTKMRYDPLGRQIRLEDAIGNVWRWGFDSLGRQRDKQDPDAGHWTYTYDDAGRPRKHVDAKAQTTTLDYEPSGRLKSRTSGAGVVTYTYGQSQNVGRLMSITSPEETTELDYDEMGRVVRQKRTIDGFAYVVKKEYDDAGFLLGTEYPDHDTVGTKQNPLVYDAAGRLRAIPGIVTEIEYDAAGRPLVRVNANPTKTTWDYTGDRGFLDRIRTTGPAGLIQDLDYDIDPAGLVDFVTSPATDEGWDYFYDDLYRLRMATNLTSPGESQTFDFDDIGRMTFNSRVGEYDYPAVGQPRPHAPTAVAGQAFTYDANGNLEHGGGRSPLWDAENRLVQLGTTHFTYDGTGERIKKVSSEGTSLYPFGDDYEITNGKVTKYVSVEGLGVVAKRVGEGTASQTFWMHTDHLGSIQVITDADAQEAPGEEIRRRKYRPYGETFEETGSHAESRGWIDQRNDSETGLTYLHARYYDPQLGLFLSPDPIGPTGGLNQYGYSLASPTNGSDRSGLLMDPACGGPFHSECSGGADGYYFILGGGIGISSGDRFLDRVNDFYREMNAARNTSTTTITYADGSTQTITRNADGTVSTSNTAAGRGQTVSEQSGGCNESGGVHCSTSVTVDEEGEGRRTVGVFIIGRLPMIFDPTIIGGRQLPTTTRLPPSMQRPPNAPPGPRVTPPRPPIPRPAPPPDITPTPEQIVPRMPWWWRILHPFEPWMGDPNVVPIPAPSCDLCA
jgi:RHS repeat-associated protein